MKTRDDSYSYPVYEVNQPIGQYLLCVIPASELLEFFEIKRRQQSESNEDGVQRAENNKRISDIANYVTFIDATFPTAVVLAVDGEYEYKRAQGTLNISGKVEIVDGQHRVLGLQKAYQQGGLSAIAEFDLPCVLMLEPTLEQKAYVFGTINGNQTKVNSSMVAELFGVGEESGPWRILHLLARRLNYSEESPFNKRLKMLGVRSQDSESLTQGTFVKTLLRMMSRDPSADRDLIVRGKWDELDDDEKLPLRTYLVKNKGDLLLGLITNIFEPIKKNFPDQWENHEQYILCKSTGFTGIMKGMTQPIIDGKNRGDLSYEYFDGITRNMSSIMKSQNKEFRSSYFPPGGQGENLVRDLVGQAYNMYREQNSSLNKST